MKINVPRVFSRSEGGREERKKKKTNEEERKGSRQIRTERTKEGQGQPTTHFLGKIPAHMLRKQVFGVK